MYVASCLKDTSLGQEHLHRIIENGLLPSEDEVASRGRGWLRIVWEGNALLGHLLLPYRHVQHKSLVSDPYQVNNLAIIISHWQY